MKMGRSPNFTRRRP